MSTTLSRWILIIALICAQMGCRLREKSCDLCLDDCAEPILNPSNCGADYLKFEEPCLDCPERQIGEWQGPDQFADYDNIGYKPMTLQECIELALQNSRIMRDLGATVLRSPNAVTSVHDPSIAYTDPRFGEEAALSAFDANFFASSFYETNDRIINNQFFGENGQLFQDLANFRYGLRKRTSTGSLLTATHNTDYVDTNQTGTFFSPSGVSWDTYVDLEMRQPLLRGYGVEFNRIAGPNQTVGSFNGVLIARANTDISMAEFQQGVREFLSNIENAYWDLYFAYRDLDAKIVARNAALNTWEEIKELKESQDAIDQAREQYYRFQAEVIDAINGRLVDRTSIDNGTSGGTFRATGGVRVAERRLRLILGIEINGSELIQPTDQPTEAAIKFDWNSAVNSATANRPELRKQRWNIKQRELELVASKNYLLPQLDFVGRYRWRGFGGRFDSVGGAFDPNNIDINSSALADLVGGDRQEGQVGLELTMPVGFRKAHAAVRNSELRLSRERALLHEQKRQVVYGVSNAMAELKRAYEVRLTSYNRYLAAKSQLQSLAARRETDITVPTDLVLEAQRRVVDASIQYYRSQVEYALAIKNVHFEQGTLLQYCNVGLNESAWDCEANDDASLRDMLRTRPLNYVRNESVISRGEVPVGATGVESTNDVYYEMNQAIPVESESSGNGMPETTDPDSSPGSSGIRSSIGAPATPISSSISG